VIDLGGGNTLSRFGIGHSVAPSAGPVYQSVKYSSWQRGMIASVSPENTPENAGRDVMDLMIDRDDSLIRPPGLVVLQDYTPRSLRWIFQQAGLDFSTELVVIDAPYLGYKPFNILVFVNAGIGAPGALGWNAVDILGTLLFSDGTALTYTREPGAVVVTDISAEIIARTFANAFGRSFAGAWTDPIDGLQGLGIKWNATTGLVADWSGVGSGEELLISNSLAADKIVALRPIGFDALAVLCRSSLWIGYPTGDADRPADFRIRYASMGCVAEPTATISPAGVSFLSDEGVVNFNLNEATIISEEINSELLPLDYGNLDQYKMIYMPVREMLYLQTPTCTWIYEFPRRGIHEGRWTRRSFVLSNLLTYTDQDSNIYWGTVAGRWSDYTDRTWAEMIESQANTAPLLYGCLPSAGVVPTDLVREDPTETRYAGIAMESRWETRQSAQELITEQFTTLGFEIEYLTNSDCSIVIETPDENGDFNNTLTQVLSNTLGVRRRAMIWSTSTGMGIKCRYKPTAGRPKIFSIRQIFADSGPVIGSAG
jgi:hypothetical protein